MKALLAAAAGLALASLAGCSGPLIETVGPGTCPPLEWTEVRLSVEGQPPRHALFVAGTAFRPALDCDAPPRRTDLNATAGVVTGAVGRDPLQEVRLFFEDGTLRLGIDLPSAATLDLVVRPGSPPTLTNHGQPVAVARHEWLAGPEAGQDAFHPSGLQPLGNRNETMAVTVASPWNEGLFVQAGLTHGGDAGIVLGPDGGRVRITVAAPNGTVVREAEVEEPDNHVSIQLGPDLAPGVWIVTFEMHASNRTEPQVLSTVSTWLTY